MVVDASMGKKCCIGAGMMAGCMMPILSLYCIHRKIVQEKSEEL